MLHFPTALSRFDAFRMQYDSNGAVKPFGYMDGPWVLQEKASYANVVSIVSLDQRLSRVIFLQVSLSGSKDNQEALETKRGGALKWVGLVQIVFLVHDLSLNINFAGVYRMHEKLR